MKELWAPKAWYKISQLDFNWIQVQFRHSHLTFSMQSLIPDYLDPYQFEHRPNRNVDDAI
jgi:hypothetical protein